MDNFQIARFVIFIPAYNASRTILETLNGIGDAANVLDSLVDVVIFDDCSSDNTFNLSSSYRHSMLALQVFRNDTNVGERATINKAFQKFVSHYKWAFIIHADDIPTEDWLKCTLEVIESSDKSSTFTVWSSFNSFDDLTKEQQVGDVEGSFITGKFDFTDARKFLKKVTSSWHVSGAAINLELFDKIGGFDQRLFQYGDTDFFVRGILKQYSDVYIRRCLTNYRVIKSSVSFVSKKQNRDILEILYLVDKFDFILLPQDRRSMLKIGIGFGVRRSLKAMLNLRIQASMKSLELTGACLVKYFN